MDENGVEQRSLVNNKVGIGLFTVTLEQLGTDFIWSHIDDFLQCPYAFSVGEHCVRPGWLLRKSKW